MSQSVALPVQPANPEQFIPPTLTTPVAPTPETPKAILKRAKEVAKVLKQFVRENPSLKLLLDGKKYPYAPVWQLCAACYGVTPMVTETEELLTSDGKEAGYIATAHAIDATGRVISGAEATCMYSESDWHGKPSFQLRSMAETRACLKVLSNLFRHVMVLSGFAPTPAEEMGGPPKRERELTTPCYECGNKVTKKRALQTRKKYGKELCLECGKKADDQSTGMATIADPKQVAEHIAQVKERKKKANGAQPIVEAMDAGEEEIPA